MKLSHYLHAHIPIDVPSPQAGGHVVQLTDWRATNLSMYSRHYQPFLSYYFHHFRELRL